jgi:ferredoxin-NADP reductase
MKFYSLTVNDIINETLDAKSIIFKPRDEDITLFKYQSGQYLTFRIPLQGTTNLERCYSLSSTPIIESELKVTVKRINNGLVSNWFHDILQVGDVIDVAKPKGRFILQPATNPILFFAAGSGITPVISIIKNTLNTTNRLIYLIYANQNQESIIFHEEIQRLSEKYKYQFTCHYHISSVLGRLTEDIILDFINLAYDAHLYICGPESFMNFIKEVSVRNNFNENNIFLEYFNSPDITEDDENANTSKSKTIVAPKGISKFTITLDENICEVPYKHGSTLLESILSAGFDPSYLCKEAHCGSCMAVRKSGEVAMKKTTSLSKRDLSRDYILLCQAIPLSKDVWVDCDS